MRRLLVRLTVVGTAAAVILLAAYLFIPGGQIGIESRNRSGSVGPSGHVRQLESRIRELSSRLSESERRVAEWEDSWRRGEVPEYTRERWKSQGRPAWPGLREHRTPGAGAGTDSTRAAGRRPAEAPDTASAAPHGAQGTKTAAKKAAHPDKEPASADAGKAARGEPRYVGGLLGLYYQGRHFENLKLVMTDYEVDFDFADQSPDRIIIEDNFSIKWVGYVKIAREANYTFHTLSDDGVRLWIDGRPVINNWGDHAATHNSGGISLKEGYHSLRLDFYENGGVAEIRLYWSCDRFAREIVPPANLYHDPDYEKKVIRELR